LRSSRDGARASDARSKDDQSTALQASNRQPGKQSWDGHLELTSDEIFDQLGLVYLFDADFCNVASGWEKGVVEKQRWGSFAELNAWLGQRCRALWGEVRHPEHEQFSVAEMLEHERAHLMPMPAPFDGYVEKPARVSSTSLVSVARNRCSVPCELVGQMVSTRLYPGSVAVVAGDQIVACHDRLSNAGETRYDWQPYIPLLLRKPSLTSSLTTRWRSSTSKPRA
jgi:hypothetical protein